MNRSLLFTLIIAAGSFVGCDREHDATPALREFLDALQYGNVDGAYSRHIDSTAQSAWCSPPFQAALRKAQTEPDKQECVRVRSMTTSDLDSLPDEVRLAVQIAGWACENPDGSCQDYAGAVFRQSVADHPLVTSKPRSYTIRRMFGEDARAVAYVDLVLSDGATEHRTFELQKIESIWHVSKGFLQ